MRTVLLAVVVVLLAACKSDAPNCSIAVGSCAPGGQYCGVSASCAKDRYELACTPPTSIDTKQLECHCIENGVIGKTLQITYPLQGDANAVMKSACGFKL